MVTCFSGPAVRVDVPNEGVNDEAVVLAGGAEEGPGGDVALGVAELVGGGVDEVGAGDGLGGRNHRLSVTRQARMLGISRASGLKPPPAGRLWRAYLQPRRAARGGDAGHARGPEHRRGNVPRR